MRIMPWNAFFEKGFCRNNNLNASDNQANMADRHKMGNRSFCDAQCQKRYDSPFLTEKTGP